MNRSPNEPATTPRPSAELLERLRDDKRRLHAAARALSPAEKVQRVIDLQRIVLPQIARRRVLRGHEFVWGEETRKRAPTSPQFSSLEAFTGDTNES